MALAAGTAEPAEPLVLLDDAADADGEVVASPAAVENSQDKWGQ